MVRLLIKVVVDISDDSVHIKFCTLKVKRFWNTFLNPAILAIETFFLEYCACLRSDAFSYIYSNLKLNVDYFCNHFKIVNQHYLQKISKTFHK